MVLQGLAIKFDAGEACTCHACVVYIYIYIYSVLIRLMTIVEISARLGHCWVLENPATSIIHLAATFQKMLASVGAWRCTINLGWFGAPTPKPVV